MNWNNYQENVFKWLGNNNEGNGFVDSVAGSGKTAVLEESVVRTSWKTSVLASAFNVDIRDVLRERFKGKMNVKVANFNGMGWGNLLRLFPEAILQEDKVNILFSQVVNEDQKKISKFGWLVKKMIDLLRYKLEYSPSWETVWRLMDYYGFEIEDRDSVKEEFFDLLIKTYVLVKAETRIFDFNDQVFMVLFRNIDLPKYDLIVVDEYQDANEAQDLLLRRSLRKGGRLVAFGDPYQSIYGFRGASPNIIKNFLTKATRLPLSICYRCSWAVVQEAKKIVNHIEAANGNPEGSVNKLQYIDYRPGQGDMVLCRINAPLIEEVLKDPSNRIMLGRDWLEDLEDFFFTILPLGIDSDTALKKLDEYRMGKKTISVKLEDKLRGLKVLLEGSSGTTEASFKLKQMLKARAGNNNKLIRYCSIHKSKGLQAARVWILENSLLPHPNAKLDWQREEEDRLRYVATTRAQVELNLID